LNIFLKVSHRWWTPRHYPLISWKSHTSFCEATTLFISHSASSTCATRSLQNSPNWGLIAELSLAWTAAHPFKFLRNCDRTICAFCLSQSLSRISFLTSSWTTFLMVSIIQGFTSSRCSDFEAFTSGANTPEDIAAFLNVKGRGRLCVTHNSGVQQIPTWANNWRTDTESNQRNWISVSFAIKIKSKLFMPWN
jgi:hypothetical protein